MRPTLAPGLSVRSAILRQKLSAQRLSRIGVESRCYRSKYAPVIWHVQLEAADGWITTEESDRLNCKALIGFKLLQPRASLQVFFDAHSLT